MNKMKIDYSGVCVILIILMAIPIFIFKSYIFVIFQFLFLISALIYDLKKNGRKINEKNKEAKISRI